MTHKGGQILSTFHLNYSSDGLMESINTTGNEPRTFYDYDAKGNVIKTTNHLTDPMERSRNHTRMGIHI